jgi:hypothetical protein
MIPAYDLPRPHSAPSPRSDGPGRGAAERTGSKRAAARGVRRGCKIQSPSGRGEGEGGVCARGL